MIVRTPEELTEVVAGIEANPQASAVLVQVLRSTELLDPLQALAVESLGYATLQAGAEFEAWLTDRRSRKDARLVPPREDMVLLQRDGDRLEIVLNSPETRNSLSAAMRDALTEAFRLVVMPARYLAPHGSRYRFRLHGACIGAGIELPAFAGELVAAPDTFFRLPEIGMGLIPGAGGCVSIPRRIGRQRTALMAITNRQVGADVALAWGLIDAIDT
jgi:enoyl-CoA hydratase